MNFDTHQITVCTHVPTDPEDSDEILDLMSAARDISRPDVLHNEDIHFIEDEVGRSSIEYADGSFQDSLEELGQNMIRVDVREGDRFHVHSNISYDNLDSILEVHEEMVSRSPEIDLRFSGVAFSTSQPANSTIESIEFVEVAEDSPPLEAINFEYNGHNVTIQDREGDTVISAVRSYLDPIEGSKLGERVHEIIEEASTVVNGVIA